ncbi:MAG: hypothetical protein K2Y05_10500 [Hyphomicrobiaceae bacterium]|nr:hypothetical protein [Hyphomicrobiaceae bacterium]
MDALKRLCAEAKGELYEKRDGYTMVNMGRHVARMQVACLFETHGEALVAALETMCRALEIEMDRTSRDVAGIGPTHYHQYRSAKLLLAAIEKDAGAA